MKVVLSSEPRKARKLVTAPSYFHYPHALKSCAKSWKVRCAVRWSSVCLSVRRMCTATQLPLLPPFPILERQIADARALLHVGEQLSAKRSKLRIGA